MCRVRVELSFQGLCLNSRMDYLMGSNIISIIPINPGITWFLKKPRIEFTFLTFWLNLIPLLLCLDLFLCLISVHLSILFFILLFFLFFFLSQFLLQTSSSLNLTLLSSFFSLPFSSSLWILLISSLYLLFLSVNSLNLFSPSLFFPVNSLSLSILFLGLFSCLKNINQKCYFYSIQIVHTNIYRN